MSIHQNYYRGGSVENNNDDDNEGSDSKLNPNRNIHSSPQIAS